MAKKQLFGIKFPFQNESENNYFLDLNETYEEKVKGELVHLIFTPKGQRYRNPDFGTNLIKYMFEPNDSETWKGVQDEITSQVKKYLPNISFKNINLYRDEDNGNHLYANIEYSVIKGKFEKKDNITLRID